MPATPPPDETPPGRPDDPVLARRRRIARWAELGQRVGYSLFGIAIVLFVVATFTDLPGGLVAAVIVCLVLGSVVLAPAIVAGYGVRAADREDREQRAQREQREQRTGSAPPPASPADSAGSGP